MDWSKIKTIFILTFLILDVYLLYQFMKIRDANKYEFITEASFEEKLKADEIKYVELPSIPIKDQYISAKTKTFKKDDILKLKDQVIISKDGNTLTVKLEKPIQLPSKFEPSVLASFIKDNILNGDRYQFWEKDDKKNIITYFQQYDHKTLYKNINAMITFTLNKDNQVISYTQTYLEDIEKLTEKEEILPPLKAIETLHQNGMLKPKSKITNVEFGYSTLIQPSQVLAPTWHIVVNDKENLFVNAFEGQIIDFNSDKNKVVE
jgi:regulatory protein YycI of two-component signal transduction system YycFG